MDADEQQGIRAKRVTIALAELNLLFSLSKNTGTEERLWQLGPFPPDPPQQSPIDIQLYFNASWVVVLSTIKLNVTPDTDLLTRILGIALQVPVVKVGMSQSDTPEGVDRQLVVSSDIAEERIDAHSLKDAIGAVVACVRILQSQLAKNEDTKSTD